MLNGEQVGEYPGRPSPVGISQGRSPQFADTEMVVVMSLGIPHRLELAQAARPAQLAADQADQMGPAAEALVVGIAVVTIHNCAELSAINRLEQAAQNATPVAHAWFFILSEPRQPERTGYATSPDISRS